MNRRLRLSSRPLIVFGVIFGIVASFALSTGIDSARQSGLLDGVLFLVVIYGFLIFALTSVRVSVRDEGIAIRRWYVSTQFIPFSSIERSDIQILAERDWPLMITIRKVDGTSVGLGLKIIRKEDAAWFCSLPQLKCHTHRGLTRAP